MSIMVFLFNSYIFFLHIFPSLSSLPARYTYAESLDCVRPKLGTLILGRSLLRIS